MLVGWLLAATGAVATPVDYDRGYRDGYHDRDMRDKERRNKDYREGYKDGEAHRRAGDKGGSDYDKGYREGYRGDSLSRSERDNKNFMRGYRAGQAARVAGVEQRPPAATVPVRSVSELPGRPAWQLAADMTSLGYRSLGELKDGRNRVTLWRGTSDSDCYRVGIKGARVSDVAKIPETECR
jgi:hypothetical protein